MPTNRGLTPAEEEIHLLNVFWSKVAAGEDRLELLGILAQITIERAPDWNQAAIRAAAAQHALTAECCFGCQTHDRRLYWHHVIQIQNGGSNYLRNRVAICLRCHSTIHPWLPANRPGEQKGGEWWSLADVLRDVERREGAESDLFEGRPVVPSEVKE